MIEGMRQQKLKNHGGELACPSIQKNSLVGTKLSLKPCSQCSSHSLALFLSGAWLQGLLFFSGVLKGFLGELFLRGVKCLMMAGWLGQTWISCIFYFSIMIIIEHHPLIIYMNCHLSSNFQNLPPTSSKVFHFAFVGEQRKGRVSLLSGSGESGVVGL